MNLAQWIVYVWALFGKGFVCSSHSFFFVVDDGDGIMGWVTPDSLCISKQLVWPIRWPESHVQAWDVRDMSRFPLTSSWEVSVYLAPKKYNLKLHRIALNELVMPTIGFCKDMARYTSKTSRLYG